MKRLINIWTLPLEKVVGYEGDGDTNCNKITWNGLQTFGKKAGGIGCGKKNREHPHPSIVKIS